LLRIFYKTRGFVATKKMKVLSGTPDGFDFAFELIKPGGTRPAGSGFDFKS